MDNSAFGFIIAIVIIVLVGYALSGSSLISSSSEPLATGAGNSGEIRNPQPINTGNSSSIFGSNAKKSSVASQSSSSSSNQKQMPVQTLKPGYSPFEGAIRISRVERGASNAQNEYISIRNGGFFGWGSSDKPIDIAGWTVENYKHEKYAISQAVNIPFIDVETRDIFLPAGGEVYIITGTTDFGYNFRENGCIGYFSQYYKFTPSLSGSCIDRQSNQWTKTYLLDKGMTGACIDFISSLSSCRVPQINFENAGRIGNDCIEYISKNVNYNGCVKNFRDDKNFFKNIWRVYMRRAQKFFDPRHDRVILRDKDGLIVDQFEY